MPLPTVAFETLGCKVNQYESSHLLEKLERASYSIVPFQRQADIYIVNSCAVTARAGYQTRQLLRRAHRLNPDATLVVMGCDAQLEPERFVSQALATHVLGTLEKFDLLQWLRAPGVLHSPLVQVSNSRRCETLLPLPVSRMLGDRARAFLKIQDGCDAFCSYCVVPMTRGRSRSLPTAGALEEFERLTRAGYREVVLTGIHLGQWGRDLAPTDSLSQLLAAFAASSEPSRIRLSSIEPVEWNSDLMAAIAASDRICPHFHVPLQSGDRDVLKRMGRPYAPELYEETVRGLARRFPGAAIGADVMVGFPGETDAQFQSSYSLIERAPIDYLHVFPFSPRPGTPAARWRQRVTGKELKARAKGLRDLGDRKRREFQMRQVGRWVEVLMEAQVTEDCWQGTSENYLPVRISSTRPLPIGEIVRARLESWTPQGLTARVS